MFWASEVDRVIRRAEELCTEKYEGTSTDAHKVLASETDYDVRLLSKSLRRYTIRHSRRTYNRSVLDILVKARGLAQFRERHKDEAEQFRFLLEMPISDAYQLIASTEPGIRQVASKYADTAARGPNSAEVARLILDLDRDLSSLVGASANSKVALLRSEVAKSVARTYIRTMSGF